MTKSLRDFKVKGLIEEIEDRITSEPEEQFYVLITELSKQLNEKWGNEQKRGKGY